MAKLIDFDNYPVSTVLNQLLKDKTTGKNIIFATSEYAQNVAAVSETDSISANWVKRSGNGLIQPRVMKSIDAQIERTRKKAEVFTPSWICNKMNNHCDAEWFGRENVFNEENGQNWKVTRGKIKFDKQKDWQKYVDSKRLEITCGEAPYIVSRYDTTTGEPIPIKKRIGILDRKLRVVNENVKDEEEWLEWVYRAFQSVYGYEFQGDNLLIARINLLITFVDYVQDRLGRNPTDSELKKITNIIVWNLWQMDGITGTIPYGKPTEENKQLSFFDFAQGINDSEEEVVDCKIYDWRADRSFTYRSIKEGQ